MKLTDEHLEFAEEVYQEQRGDLSLRDYFEYMVFSKQYQIEDGLRPAGWDPRRVMANRLGVALSAFDWEDRALALRIKRNDIEGFAKSVSVPLRAGLASESVESFTCTWEILRAVGIGDLAIARKQIEVSCYPKTGRDIFSAIANITRHAVLGDWSSFDQACDALKTSKGRGWTGGIRDAYVGMANSDPSEVAAGLKKIIVNYTKEHAGVFPQLICLVAHGVARLAYQKNPSNLAAFKPKADAAWDPDLFTWTLSHQVDFSDLDLNPISEELHKTLIQLNTPRWFTSLPEQVETSQILELTDGTVKEVFQRWITDFGVQHFQKLLQEEAVFLQSKGLPLARPKGMPEDPHVRAMMDRLKARLST